MNTNPKRWLQRLEHLNASLEFLSETLKESPRSKTICAGIIKAFEMSFELAWKTQKDYLNFKGHSNLQSPRDVLKEAFSTGILEDGHLWLNILEERNKLVYTYESEAARKAVEEIENKFTPAIFKLRDRLEKEKS